MPNTKVVGIIFPYILTPIPNLYDHSFPRYGQITFLTFRLPTTLTFDLKFWKYLSVTVYPYVICMPSFIMIGWEMAEILHFEILRKHGQTHTQTNRQTNRQTDRHGHYNTSPSPYGGRGNKYILIFSTRPRHLSALPCTKTLNITVWMLTDRQILPMWKAYLCEKLTYVKSLLVTSDQNIIYTLGIVTLLMIIMSQQPCPVGFRM